VRVVNKLVALLLLAAVLVPASPARADDAALDAALAQRVQALAHAAVQQAQPAAQGLRVDVRVGRLDPRLKLAPCTDVQPYLPAGTRLWGATRIGLRCVDGAVRWNVFLPLTVAVYGPALVATGPLAAGATLAASDLQLAEVDLAARPDTALARSELALGRTLARPLAAGQALRAGDLRARQWFAAGDTVRIVATGRGWRVHGEGQALNPGIEGQAVRVRTESGRVVSGLANAQRQVEVAL
jgi:flagella basal body P-ring formation protein FlgA